MSDDFDDEIAQTIPANIYMFAGASDSQQSTEISNVKTFQLPDPAGKAGGACTSALLQTLYRDEGDDDIRYTWAETLQLMREKIEEIGLNQEPQLSTSRPIDVNEEIEIVPYDCEGTKRALLVGINYEGEPNALTGCQKDTRNVKEFLINVCGFERENMLILMDDGKHHQPTKQLIEDGLARLAEISQPGDCIFFQFSGHGGRIADRDGDEDDGYDEILIPGDYKESGQIVDDWIYSEFVTKIQAGVHVVALIDCCHSGTAMDLPYVCNVGENEIRRSEGFGTKKAPQPDLTTAARKSEKDKKKKKAGTEKKPKKPEKKEKEKKTTKPKSSKKKAPEPEPEPEPDPYEEDQDYEEEEDIDEDVEGEDYDYDNEPEPEPEPEPQEEKSKKKRGIFGFGKKK